MSGECQVNVKSQSELDIGGRETCLSFSSATVNRLFQICHWKIKNKVKLVTSSDSFLEFRLKICLSLTIQLMWKIRYT